MTAPAAVMLAIALCAAGAAVSFLLSRSKTAAGWAAFAAVTASSVLVLRAAVRVLVAGPDGGETFARLPALGSALRFHVDGLSAIFLGLVAVAAALAALYSVGYIRRETEYGAGRYYPYLLLFIGGMYGILAVTDMMVFFFVFWQLMTLPSYALIRYEHRHIENVRAANRYLLMMQAACVLIMAGALALGRGGPAGQSAEAISTYDFDALSAALPGVLGGAPLLAAAAFGLMLVGFGVKAGMWPFGQMWLPDAHPAAPSPVSALLSGVMIKTGVYGLMRTFIWLVPADALPLYPAAAWGGVLATLGTVTLFVGTMQALKQERSKRLLAFSSIGQVGYILLGLGASTALLGRSGADPAITAVAALALYGALFHTINHATFKSLLFLNAGSVLRATATQDLNKLGGLVKYMPLTAATAFVASFAIAGVPLFNGFASKWAILVSTILGSAQVGYLALYGVVAVLTSAITLALFMKFFGVMFLSRTSALVTQRAAQGPLEADWTMLVPQAVLALTCVVVGLAPALVFTTLGAALAASATGLAAAFGAQAVAPAGTMLPWAAAQSLGGQALLAPLALAAVLALLLVAVMRLARIGAAKRRTADAWLCGYAREAEVHRYAAHNLYAEVNRRFRWLGGVR